MALDSCPICGGKLERKTEESGLGKHDYDECQACGERYYFESIMDAVDILRTATVHFASTGTRTDGNWYDLCPECAAVWH